MNAPFCINCKYFERSKFDFHKCLSPRIVRTVNAVTGETKAAYCESERNYDVAGGCGPSGRFFEPMENVE